MFSYNESLLRPGSVETGVKSAINIVVFFIGIVILAVGDERDMGLQTPYPASKAYW